MVNKLYAQCNVMKPVLSPDTVTDPNTERSRTEPYALHALVWHHVMETDRTW